MTLRKWTKRNAEIIASEKKAKEKNVYHTNKRKQKNCKTLECVFECKVRLTEKKDMFQLYVTKARTENSVVPTLANFLMKNSTLLYAKNVHVIVMLLTATTSHMTYTVVVIEVESLKCRAVVDTGEGSFYILSKLISGLNTKIIRK